MVAAQKSKIASASRFTAARQTTASHPRQKAVHI
jgi:hypothetical protein